MLPNKEGKKMPHKFKFTREEIIQAALDLTRESGIAAVTAVIFLFSLAIAQRYVPKKSDHVSAWGLLSIPVFSSNDDIP